MKTAIVLGGSRGIGKAIADSLKSIGCDVIATSKNELDTSSLESVSSFAEKHNEVDILVLNTGGPEPKEFFSVTEDDWNHYHNQLFLGFCLLANSLLRILNTLEKAERYALEIINFGLGSFITLEDMRNMYPLSLILIFCKSKQKPRNN